MPGSPDTGVGVGRTRLTAGSSLHSPLGPLIVATTKRGEADAERGGRMSGRRVRWAALGALVLAMAALPLGTSGAATNATVRASVATDGTQGNDESFNPSVSADGRFVVFESDASNLVAGDTNGDRDVFVSEVATGKTTRVSVTSSGAQGNGDSGYDPIISGDGRFVAFASYASNLVGGDSNGTRDMFVHDRASLTTRRVSVASSGAQGNGNSFDPFISADGLVVSFSSKASNLVAGDSNGKTDIFVHDLVTGLTRRVSIATGGGQANGTSEDAVLSGGGRFVAFSSLATNLVSGDTNSVRDTFVHDRATGTTTRVSVATGGAQENGASGYNPSISIDGGFVAFNSAASNLVNGDTNGDRDVFVHELATRTTTRVSVSSSGAQANGSSSSAPSISEDGRFVTFLSSATNLVSGDTNGDRDVFVRDRDAGTTTRVSVTSDGSQARGGDCFSQPFMRGRGSGGLHLRCHQPRSFRHQRCVRCLRLDELRLRAA